MLARRAAQKLWRLTNPPPGRLRRRARRRLARAARRRAARAARTRRRGRGPRRSLSPLASRVGVGGRGGEWRCWPGWQRGEGRLRLRQRILMYCIDPCASLVAYLCLPHMPKSAVDNPARVAPGQRKYIAFPDGQRFAPIRPAPSGARVRCTAGYALWAGCCGVATCQHAACCSGWQLARHMLHCDSDSP